MNFSYSRTVFLFLALFLAGNIRAQFGKDLINSTKAAAKRKANQKIEEAIEKTLNKADSSKSKQKNKKTAVDSGTTPQAQSEVKGESTPGSEVIVQTNIKCTAGKQKVEMLLREIDGLLSAMIDINTGKLYIFYDPGLVGMDELTAIVRENGFEADGKKPTSTKNSPCR